MAYSNWGAFVFRDGVRMKTNEDTIPYQEESTPPFPSVLLTREKTLGVYHAVLGSGKVRLCVYKTTPIIFLEGRDVTAEVEVRLTCSRERTYQIKRGDKIFGEREGKFVLLRFSRKKNLYPECFQQVDRGVREGILDTPNGLIKRWRYDHNRDEIVVLDEDPNNELPKFTEDEGIWEGELEGHRFRIDLKINEVVLELRQPDGVLWAATAGYLYGAGHMEDEEAVAPVANL